MKYCYFCVNRKCWDRFCKVRSSGDRGGSSLLHSTANKELLLFLFMISLMLAEMLKIQPSIHTQNEKKTKSNFSDHQ